MHSFRLMSTFTIVHVVISLVGIVSGFVVLGGLIAAKPCGGWTSLFLWSTVATSVTGFFLPAHHFMPSHAVGIISMVVLAVAIFALHARHLAGGWRRTYVITAVLALYLNVFVLVVQLFAKVSALKALAPTQSEPPFAIAQLIVLVIFIALGVMAARRFRPEPIAI